MHLFTIDSWLFHDLVLVHVIIGQPVGFVTVTSLALERTSNSDIIHDAS